jgi:phosphoribosyl 1,2-cyclic phosphate phosphodiesterase
MNVTILGSGTSMGVPVIGCGCNVCASPDPRNSRLRASVLVEHRGGVLVIDTGPEFRIQMLRAGVHRLDAVLYTHAHADHLHGLDDLRAFNFLQDGAVPVYGVRRTLRRVREAFPYIFESGHASAVPQLALIEIDGPFQVIGLDVLPLEVEHGPRAKSTAFRLSTRDGEPSRRLAYVTDVSRIPPAAMEALADLDLLVLSALRHEPHPTHFTVPEALVAIAELRPRRAVLTHLSHALDHAALEKELPEGVEVAYDGLSLEV